MSRCSFSGIEDGEHDASHEDAVDWPSVISELQRHRASPRVVLLNDDRSAGCAEVLTLATKVFCVLGARSDPSEMPCWHALVSVVMSVASLMAAS